METLRAMVGTGAVVTILLTSLSTAGAFEPVTSRGGFDFAAGTTTMTSPVAIDDDRRGAAMFAGPLMKPGDDVQACIVVTYSGSLTPTDVSLYGAVSGTGLDAYLNLTIEVGSGGSARDCRGFIVAAVVYSGTLAGFAASHTNYSDGIRAWSPTSSPESRTYRFTLALQEQNAAQGKSASADFIWEAQNR
jgi:hypothetical protein